MPSDYPTDVIQRGAHLLDRMLGDPRTAAQAEKLVEIINPNSDLTQRREAVLAPVRAELEQERKAREALEARLAERETREAAAEQARQEAEMLRRVESVKKTRGLSDEAMERVFARMRDQNNPDVESAAAFVADSIPKAAPQVGIYDNLLPQTVDPYGTASGDEAWASLHKDPNAWMTEKLRSIARDPEFARLGQQ